MKKRRFASGGEIPDFSRLTFKEAFAAARGGPGSKKPLNDKFTWNGRTYTTELAEDKPAAKASNESAAETARLKRQSDTKSEAKPSTAAKTSSSKEEDSGSSNLGTILGGAAAAALGAAAASRRNPSVDTSNRVEPHNSPIKDITPREAAAKRVGVNTPRLASPVGRLPRGGGGGGGNSRNLMLGSDLEVRGVKDAMRREIMDDDDSRFADEGNPNYKRGGKVKKMAHGGAVKSSASKRADGIAQRGKTKGRIY